MKIRRKLSTCQNCGYLLDRTYNFCPQCGQENDDKNVSFGIVFREFMDTFFAIDGSFFRTLRPFVSNPGFLTLEYISGKRKSYANPIRLYLIISVFFFFTIGILGSNMVQSDGDIDPNAKVDDDLVSYFSNVIGSDSLSSEDKGKLLEDRFEELPAAEQLKLLGELGDEKAGKLYEWEVVDYTSMNQNYFNWRNYIDDSTYYAKMAKDTTEFITNRINDPLIRELDYLGTYTDEQILDSMHLGELKWWEHYLAIQKIRTERSGGEALAKYILQNLPIMMLIVIPISAIILKLVYVRRKRLYLQHLIHALHLHSFAYLVYGIANLLLMYLIVDEQFEFFFVLITFIGVSTYAYLSFLKVYRQGWLKTLIKFNLVGFIYFITILIFFSIEAAISYLLY